MIMTVQLKLQNTAELSTVLQLQRTIQKAENELSSAKTYQLRKLNKRMHSLSFCNFPSHVLVNNRYDTRMCDRRYIHNICNLSVSVELKPIKSQ